MNNKRFIVDNRTGEELTKSDVYLRILPSGSDISQIKRMQNSIRCEKKENNAIYLCKACGQAITFKHRFKKSEDSPLSIYLCHFPNAKDCEYLARHNNDRINNFPEESKKHIDTKNDIVDMLLSIGANILDVDTKYVISKHQVKKQRKARRKPDIFFELNGNKIAVEVQVSDPTLEYVLEKEEFYKEEGIYLMWVFSGHYKDILKVLYTVKSGSYSDYVFIYDRKYKNKCLLEARHLSHLGILLPKNNKINLTEIAKINFKNDMSISIEKIEKFLEHFQREYVSNLEIKLEGKMNEDDCIYEYYSEYEYKDSENKVKVVKKDCMIDGHTTVKTYKTLDELRRTFFDAIFNKKIIGNQH